MKKKILMASSLVAVSAVSILGTTAYLQDTDKEENIMTLGNVDIEQHEYERKVDEDGNYIQTLNIDKYGYTPEVLQPFTQNKPIYPAVYQDGIYKWDDRNGSQEPSGEGSHQQSWGQVGASGSDQLFDTSMKNVQDKFVFVENTGESDAYYRTLIAVECPIDLDAELIHLNMTASKKFDWNRDNEGIPQTFDVVIDQQRYVVFEATYTDVLKPGVVSRPSLLQVYLDPKATNEDVAKFGDTFEILVASQAVQTTGFDSPSQALDTAFGNSSKANHPWATPVYVNDNEGLEEAIENGAEYIHLSEGNYTIPAVSDKSIAIVGSGEKTVIDRTKSVTLSNTDITIQNAKIKGANKNYVGFYHAASETYIDCTFDGEYWVYGTKAEFIDCEFNQKSSNLYNVWTYGSSDVTFENCTFNSAGKSLLVYNEGSIKDPAYVTVNNSTFNASQPVEGKAAIEIDSTFNEYVVRIKNSKEEGFATGNESGNSLWNNKKGELTTVIVDGETKLTK